MSSSHDKRLLHQAAQIAASGHGRVEPNPLVGCIITNQDDVIVGKGFHEKFGEAHAEINALNMARENAKNGTAYITLEPCNHHGKTPPCSHALIDSGVSRVVIGARDPHQQASGGASYLQEHGVEVDIVADEICKELIAPFTHRLNTDLPWITCKWAQTIDGCTETPLGESPWISCEESQQCVHTERGSVDAIIVGVGTVLSDNPSLTVRGATEHRTPIRVVIDPNLRTPIEANILNQDAPSLVVCSESADTALYDSINLLTLPTLDGVMNLVPLFEYLVSTYDATHVLVEGGSTLIQHLIKQKLVNDLWIFTSQHKSTMTPKVNMNEVVQ
ncbi:bifunctional diaminohydroxyphosphoribosylaminopyrimidine deaminase/5-amino-6-(5-phosphoribosylamino)uracil reductase RibD, partial [bacterium]|nr:bifunctional diaminohydroxyphosphoribosylaminopyrimidine deaminase/5-amino-6-(5-phosphoribosylamino)uracil reductase RibD [bacterium]